MVRIYLPVTRELLADHVATGTIPASVERFVAAGEDEEAEYGALMAAAEASGELGGDRRVVVVAEVTDPDSAVPMDRVVAVHADTSDGFEPDSDLGWFAAQEIPDLLG